MYQKNWSELAGNCDTTVYLGGGPDEVTAKWLSALIGKETRIVMNTTLSSNGGSVSYNRQGVELLAQSQVRTLPRNECIVIPTGEAAYRGLKYPTLEHPAWKAVNDAAPYFWSEETNRRMAGLSTEEKPVEEGPETPPAPTMEQEERGDEENREHRQRAGEFRRNMDAEGNPVIEQPRPMGTENPDAVNRFAFEDGHGTYLKETQTTYARQEMLWMNVKMNFDSAPAENISSTA